MRRPFSQYHIPSPQTISGTKEITAAPEQPVTEAPVNVVTDLQNNIIQNIASTPVTPEVSHEVVEPPKVEEVHQAQPVLENLPKPVVNGFMQSPPSDAVV